MVTKEELKAELRRRPEQFDMHAYIQPNSDSKVRGWSDVKSACIAGFVVMINDGCVPEDIPIKKRAIELIMSHTLSRMFHVASWPYCMRECYMEAHQAQNYSLCSEIACQVIDIYW